VFWKFVSGVYKTREIEVMCYTRHIFSKVQLWVGISFTAHCNFFKTLMHWPTDNAIRFKIVTFQGNLAKAHS